MQAQCSELTASGERCRKVCARGETKCAAHLGRVGAHTVLTPDVADKLVAMLKAGNYIGVTATAVGLNRATLNRWLARGRSDDPKDAEFKALRERIVQARAEGEARNVTIIATAAAKDWKAAAWLLERQYPARWSRPVLRQAPEPAPEPVKPDDPFREVDELAEARRKRTDAS